MLTAPRDEAVDGPAPADEPDYLKGAIASTPLVLERDADGPWRIASPNPGKADHEMVTALIKELQFAVGRGYLDEVEDYGDYGLAPARGWVTVQAGDSPPETLYLGSLSSEDEGAAFFSFSRFEA